MSYIFGNLPFTASSSDDKKKQLDISSVNYDYDYPNEINFKPGGEFHEAILQALLQRVGASSRSMSARYESWRNVDRKLTTYIDLSQSEVDVKNEDERKPVSMVVPISYASRDVILTYLMSALLDNPFVYDPTGPEDVPRAYLMSNVIQHQVRVAKTLLRIITMWSDGLTYGIGPVMIRWFKKFGWMRSAGPERVWDLKDEYNKLINIDPYNWLPDPQVTPDNIQEGEFHSMINRTNLLTLLSDEQGNPEEWFNVKYLKHLPQLTSTYNKSSESGRYDKSNYDEGEISNIKNPADIIHIFINLIPSDWHLGDGDYPQKWVFKIAGDQVIVGAKPLDSDEDEYPLTVDAPSFDGHAVSPMSMLELGYGMTEVIDWMFNSHIANVRKSINDMLIVDPFMLNMDDVMNPGPGKLIRLSKRMWGRGVKDAIMQLPVNDITRNNLTDISLALQFYDTHLGTVDPIKGTRRRGGDRVTATEISSDRVASLGRFEKLARVSHMQSMADIGRIMANNTRQYMSMPIFMNVIGRHLEDIYQEYGVQLPQATNGFLGLSPGQLIGSPMDVQSSDGTIPGSTDTQAWIEIFQILATQPYLLQRFDIFRVFKHVARALGAKNVRDFEVRVEGNQTTIENQAQQGNFAPADEFVNAIQGQGV